MKNVFFALAFMLVGSFAFGKPYKELKLDGLYSPNILCEFEIVDMAESCTITTGTQIVSNGEVIYEEVNTFHIDGMSCETFFTLLMRAF